MFDPILLVISLVFMGIGMLVSSRLKSKFAIYSQERLSSGLTGMALSFAKHSLLQGSKAGVAVLEIAPRHEVLAQQSFQTLKTRLLQVYPQIELQLTLVEPIAQTPLQIEEQRTLAQKNRPKQSF